MKKFRVWFQDHVNFCENFSSGEPKPLNPVLAFFVQHWFWPFENPHCDCCAAVRGVVYGGVVGFILGVIV